MNDCAIITGAGSGIGWAMAHALADRAQIRTLDTRKFPDRQTLVELHHKRELRTPEEVAAFATWLLLDTDAESFSR